MGLFENQTNFAVSLDKKERKEFSNFFIEESKTNRFTVKKSFFSQNINTTIPRGTRCVLMDSENWEIAIDHKISGWSTIFNQIYNFFNGKIEFTEDKLESIHLYLKLIKS